jgi:hypothetical protein
VPVTSAVEACAPRAQDLPARSRRLLALLRIAVAGTLAGIMLAADGVEAKSPQTGGTSARTRSAPAQAGAAPARRPAARSARSAARQTPRSTGGPARRSGTTVDQTVLAALTTAAARTRIEPALLAAMAARESRFDPRARNSQSSARGLMQFTEATWLEAVRDHGASHGLAREAALLKTDARTGEISAPNPRVRKRILDLRDNARLSAALAGERAAAARRMLQRELGRSPTPADLYAVHLFGPTGARRFLRALAETPERPAQEAVGADALARNRSVFVARDGGPLSLREVHAAFARDAAAGSAILAAAPRPERPGRAVRSRRGSR